MNNQKNDTNGKKICNKCKEDKLLDNFVKNKKSKDGKHIYCKECKYKIDNDYIKNNPEKAKLSRKKSYLKNKDKILEYVKEYNNQNKDKRKQYNKENRKRDKQYLEEYNKTHRNRINKLKREKKKNNIRYRLDFILRCRIYHALKYTKKCDKFIKLLGCTIDFYILHIEKQFLPEMTWENFGKIWEINHIKGLINFDLTKEEEQLKAFNYINTEPRFKTTEIAENLGYKGYIGNRNLPKNKL